MKPTQEQVIAWAREAGLWPAVTDTFPSEAERFASLAYEAGRKDENEACAKVCDEKAEEWYETRGWIDDFAKEIAAAIRARIKQ